MPAWTKRFNGGRGGWTCGSCGVTVVHQQQKALHDMDLHPEDAACLKRFGVFPVPPEV